LLARAVKRSAMNRQQALALLQARIRARAPFAPAKCLFCSNQAHFRERATTNLFCGSQCQQLIYALGMKRKNLHDRVSDVTDDALGIIFEMAYGFALYSVDEYEDLLSLRFVDKQFVRVIDGFVIPRIRFLCGAILISINDSALLKFKGLEEFVKTREYKKMGWYFEQLGKKIELVTVCQFKWLSKLTLDVVVSANIDFSTLERLEKLSLKNMEISNQQVNSIKNLSSITLDQVIQ
jgi:hypothetical protein